MLWSQLLTANDYFALWALFACRLSALHYTMPERAPVPAPNMHPEHDSATVQIIGNTSFHPRDPTHPQVAANRRYFEHTQPPYLVQIASRYLSGAVVIFSQALGQKHCGFPVPQGGMGNSVSFVDGTEPIVPAAWCENTILRNRRCALRTTVVRH
ncbi:hypothetical protein C8Q73DRAFT_225348 [Cubamyces lactineus]|nr:hypothetical protein C8Q73DRAFT_225348 [Cubamyces lactineus]